jgi:kynurenine formamidase
VSPLPRYVDLPVVEGAPAGSSWGLWGSEDQLGCLNKVTPEAVRNAAAAVKDGTVFSLNASLAIFETPLFGRPGVVHEVVELDRGLVRDETLSSYNTQASSQWDGFRHAQSRGHGFYNGLPENEVSISVWAERGMAGRGLLLDLEGYREVEGRPLRFSDADPIDVADLRGCIAMQGVTVEQGDFLVLHTGWLDWARRTSPEGLPDDLRTPGLMPSRETLALLWDLQVAAVGSDVPAVEVWPPGAFSTQEQRLAARSDPRELAGIFMHADLIALLGLPLGELWDTGRLARACREDDRWEFLLTAAPLNLPGGVASPANVVAVR